MSIKDRTLAEGVIESITHMTGRAPRPRNDLEAFGYLVFAVVMYFVSLVCLFGGVALLMLAFAS